jgi:Fe2+ transport system protein B
MKKQTSLISMTAFIILLSLSSCGKAGYEAGKKSGIKDAETYAKEKYEPEVTALETESQKNIKDNENNITTMNKNHAARIDKMNSNHAAKVNEMNSTHVSNINMMESEHATRINNMRYAHNRELDNTMKSSYSSGQRDMEKRIGEMIDLNATNKPLGTGWNDTVYSVREN